MNGNWTIFTDMPWFVFTLCSFLEPDPHVLLSNFNAGSRWSEKYKKLTETLGTLIEDFSLVRFYPLNIKNAENVADIFLTVNTIIQYGEDLDVRDKDLNLIEEDERDNSFG